MNRINWISEVKQTEVFIPRRLGARDEHLDLPAANHVNLVNHVKKTAFCPYCFLRSLSALLQPGEGGAIPVCSVKTCHSHPIRSESEAGFGMLQRRMRWIMEK